MVNLNNRDEQIWWEDEQYDESYEENIFLKKLFIEPYN